MRREETITRRKEKRAEKKIEFKRIFVKEREE